MIYPRYKTRHGEHDRQVERAFNTRSRHFRRLGVYGNSNSAQAIRWMVNNGKGIKAFRQYAPGTFEAVIRDNVEVWFRRV